MNAHCGKPMIPGIALVPGRGNPVMAFRYGELVLPIYLSQGQLQHCWKCPVCGHSIK